jgi:CBS domain containing-hemolysin-like protein
VTEPLLIVALVFLLALDWISVAARTAYVNVNHGRLQARREFAAASVDRALHVLHMLPRLRVAMVVWLIFVRFTLAGTILALLAPAMPFAIDAWVSVLVLFASAVLLFWSEWYLETRVKRHPEGWAIRLSGFVQVLLWICTPLVALPLAMAHGDQPTSEEAGSEFEEELKSLADAGQEEGLLEQGGRKMIYSVFELGDTLVREIMVPRIDVLALEVNTPLPEAVNALLASGHSRVPVYEEAVDNILGLLYAKDLLRLWRQDSGLNSLRELLRPAYFVPEAKKADELLAEMQARRVHMAVVVDEYGGVAGMVTMEDIVEEILGEIQDEFDQGEESPYQELAGGEYIFQGRVDLDDFNEVMNSDLPTDEADTLSGFIYNHFGRVPANGENLQVGDLLLTVEQVSGRRIRKVRARRVTTAPSAEEGETHADR